MSTANSSPRAAGEVDELNRILEVERRLVLRTQENYRVLKEKCVSLVEECRELRAANQRVTLESLLLENEDLRRARSADEHLAERSRQVVRELDQCTRQRVEKARHSDVDAVEELQRVFRKEIADQEAETMRERRLRDELVEENDHLLAEIRDMRAAERENERTRRMEVDKLTRQIEQLVDSGQGEPFGKERESFLQSALERLRERCGDLEEKLMQASRDASRAAAENGERTQRLERQIADESAARAEAEATRARLLSELSQMKERLRQKDERAAELARHASELLSSRAALEAEAAARERAAAAARDAAAAEHERRLAALEARLARQNEQNRELTTSLSNLNALRESLQSSDEQLKRFEAERLLGEERQKDDKERQRRERAAHDAEKEALKRERNRLEFTLAELKKRLETNPETAAEVRRLREQLRDSEDALSKTKEHYRELLRRMKTSLRNLEARHRKAQEKLQMHILL